jgi:hypothetical protein
LETRSNLGTTGTDDLAIRIRKALPTIQKVKLKINQPNLSNFRFSICSGQAKALTALSWLHPVTTQINLYLAGVLYTKKVLNLWHWLPTEGEFDN